MLKHLKDKNYAHHRITSSFKYSLNHIENEVPKFYLILTRVEGVCRPDQLSLASVESNKRTSPPVIFKGLYRDQPLLKLYFKHISKRNVTRYDL